MNRYVSVQYQKKDSQEVFSGREYTYIDGLGLMKGDMVVAPTAKGDRIAMVVKVGIPESDIEEGVLPVLKTINTLYPNEEGETEDEQ